MKRLIFAIALTAAMPLYGADDAAAILARVDQFRTPLESFAIDVELTAYTPHDKPESSKFRVYGKGSDRSVVEFVAPATEKGKLLLMLRDAMWIYMPSASRPIRISPLQRLMGQASNGDVARTSFTVDYVPKSMTESEWEGHKVYVLDLAAKDSDIAYARVQLWIDRTSYEPLRADFYVVSGKLIKRAFFRDYGQMAGRRVVTAIEIDDLLRPGYRTTMKYANLVPKENPERMFTKDALGKW
jgi:outer membrane lipoprotein-sorting protein